MVSVDTRRLYIEPPLLIWAISNLVVLFHNFCKFSEWKIPGFDWHIINFCSAAWMLTLRRNLVLQTGIWSCSKQWWKCSLWGLPMRRITKLGACFLLLVIPSLGLSVLRSNKEPIFLYFPVLTPLFIVVGLRHLFSSTKRLSLAISFPFCRNIKVSG